MGKSFIKILFSLSGKICKSASKVEYIWVNKPSKPLKTESTINKAAAPTAYPNKEI
jgi:hypothetical protein